MPPRDLKGRIERLERAKESDPPTEGLTALGKKVTKYEKLETFPKPAFCSRVIMTSDEMSAVCPVTEQPDWYIVSVEFVPDKLCIESKTFKLFVQSFREKGMFCEALADVILQEVVNAINPLSCNVTLSQKSRGGVTIDSTSTYKAPKKAGAL